MGEVMGHGELSNIHDITRTRFYKPDVHNNYLGTEIDVRTVLCVPLFNTDDQIIGVIEAINKKSNQMFRTDDIEVLTNIASHVALNIEGEGSSIRKILHFSRSQQQAVRQSSDYTRTASLQQTGATFQDDDDEDFADPIPPVAVRPGGGGAAKDKAKKDVNLISTLRNDSYKYNAGAPDATSQAAAEEAADEAARDAAAGGGDRDMLMKDTIARRPSGGRSADMERTGALGPGAYQKINRTPPTGIVSAAPDVEYDYPELSLKELKRLDSLSGHMDLVCTLDHAVNLPKADTWGTIDPYITMTIVEGNPLASDYHGPTTGRGYANPQFGYAKSSMKIQNQNPNWEAEKIAMHLPRNLKSMSPERLDNLFVHVKVSLNFSLMFECM